MLFCLPSFRPFKPEFATSPGPRGAPHGKMDNSRKESMAPLSLVAVLLSSVWTEVYVKLKKKMCDKVDNKPFLTSTVAIASRNRDYLKTNCSCMEGSYNKIGD